MIQVKVYIIVKASKGIIHSVKLTLSKSKAVNMLQNGIKSMNEFNDDIQIFEKRLTIKK